MHLPRTLMLYISLFVDQGNCTPLTPRSGRGKLEARINFLRKLESELETAQNPEGRV